jgi:hypothetical protein
MSSIREKVECAVGQAADFVKDKAEKVSGMASVKERMTVVCSCGSQLGVVDHVEGTQIKLTKNDSPDGVHHYVPLHWVDKVEGNTVTLTKNRLEAQSEWTAA